MTQKEKINVAELLKDCPRGMELDCIMYDDITLLGVDDSKFTIFPIRALRKDGCSIELTKYGQYADADYAKCIIFPKGKTTWEGFVPPYEFKDGDIVTWKDSRGPLVACIYKERLDISFSHHIALYKGGLGIIVNGEIILTNDELRLATEEEKKELFDSIKENGYKWNEETKTLEKLTPNKFDITTLKAFDKVLMRSSNAREWAATFYSHYSNNKFYGCGMYCDQCIPYEGNQHLLGTTNDCDEFYKNWE